MSKRSIAIVVAVGLVAVLVVLLVNMGKKETGGPADQQTKKAEAAERARLDRLAEKQQKLGGLPLELALSNAKTDEQREFLKRELAYQSQTREQALAEARGKLAELEREAREEREGQRTKEIQSRIKLVRKVIASLEGDTTDRD